MEQWSDPSDLDKHMHMHMHMHMQTEHIKKALAVLGSELAAAPAIHALTPIDVG